jgi:hypothetical protein
LNTLILLYAYDSIWYTTSLFADSAKPMDIMIHSSALWRPLNLSVGKSKSLQCNSDYVIIASVCQNSITLRQKRINNHKSILNSHLVHPKPYFTFFFSHSILSIVTKVRPFHLIAW